MGGASTSDEKPMYRADLISLNASIGTAIARTTDRETLAHLNGARDQISKILDPKFAAPSSSSPNVIRMGFDDIDPFTATPEQLGTCWPDYVIRK